MIIYCVLHGKMTIILSFTYYYVAATLAGLSMQTLLLPVGNVSAIIIE